MQRWRAVVPVVSIGLASAGLWNAFAPAPSRSQAAVPTTIAAAPVTTTTTSVAPTTTTTVAPTTTTSPPLPTPEGVPADARADVPVVAIGRIQIPAIGLDHEVYEGIWLTVIDEGPGHWPGTPSPGGYGNVVFAGHRVTHSHPFRDIDRLVEGDEIHFVMLDGTTATYRVTEQLIVEPSALWITDQEPGHTLTIFACHPKGSARQRIVVRGQLAEPELAEPGVKPPAG